MREINRLIPVAGVDLAARGAGYAVGLARPYASSKAARLVRGKYWGWRLGASDLQVGDSVRIEGDAIRLGEGVTLFDGGHYVTGPTGHIAIGDGTHVSRMSVLSGLGGIDIGANCAIAAQVIIYSSTTDLNADRLGSVPAIRLGVSIGDNVYVGMGARILPGVTIGANAVIAAGAVVVHDVPAGNIAKGVPAKATPRITAK